MTLSIITTNLNNLQGLQKTLASVFFQTFTDFEYIIIDGGSTDGSVDLIKKNQSKISYWQSQKDSGIYQALNQGIKQARGEYVQFLHSGDYLLDPEALNRVFVTQPDADIVYADAKRLNLDTKQIELYSQPDQLTKLFFYRYSLCHQSMFFKRELFKKFGFYREDLKIVADWAFNLKLFLNQKYTWQHLATPIVYFDQNGISSTNLALLNQEREQVLREFFSAQELEQLQKQFNFRQSFFGKVFINLGLIGRY